MGQPRPDAERGVYAISTAADLVGMGVQNLRLYEARGLLDPERSNGGTRRYSANDLDRLRRIGDLLQAGLNLAGIAMVIDLQDKNTELQAEKETQQRLKTTPTHTNQPATRDQTKQTAARSTPSP